VRSLCLFNLLYIEIIKCKIFFLTSFRLFHLNFYKKLKIISYSLNHIYLCIMVNAHNFITEFMNKYKINIGNKRFL
jgi:hypothetical protein